jgi:hypothetical protein
VRRKIEEDIQVVDVLYWKYLQGRRERCRGGKWIGIKGQIISWVWGFTPVILVTGKIRRIMIQG